MAEELLGQLLKNIFSIKGITYEKIEIYLWTKNKAEAVLSFDAFEKIEDYIVIFCLSNIRLSINEIPFTFEQFDFKCSCIDKRCCGLYFVDPDEFRFNSEIEIDDEKISELKDSLTNRLIPIVQSLFSLGSP